jgi:hypothetical protein
MKKLLEWLLSFFASKKENKIESRIKVLKESLKEIENEENSIDDVSDYFDN